MKEKKTTLKDLCDMVVAKGECTQSRKVKFGSKEFYVCIGNCPKLNGFIDKYWDNKEG